MAAEHLSQGIEMNHHSLETVLHVYHFAVCLFNLGANDLPEVLEGVGRGVVDEPCDITQRFWVCHDVQLEEGR
jgi:hypothetical protein